MTRRERTQLECELGQIVTRIVRGHAGPEDHARRNMIVNTLAKADISRAAARREALAA